MPPHTDASDKKLTDKDRAELYRALSEQMHTQYDQRRELEWKIHVSIWTLISAIGTMLITQKIYLGPIVWCLFAIVPLHLIWCVKIHIGGFRDRHFSDAYREAAVRVIEKDVTEKADDSEESVKLPPPWIRTIFRRYDKGYLWWLGAEVGTTLLLTLGVIYVDLYWVKPSTPSPLSVQHLF
jgi:hypothetical protein